MRPAVDLSNAYVIDDLGHLSVVELLAGNVIARKRIGQRPTYVVHLPETETVAVSSSMDSRIYVLDEESLENRGQIIVNGSPAGIFKNDEFLYVAEEQSNSIMIFDYNLRVKVKSLFVLRDVDVDGNPNHDRQKGWGGVQLDVVEVDVA